MAWPLVVRLRGAVSVELIRTPGSGLLINASPVTGLYTLDGGRPPTAYTATRLRQTAYREQVRGVGGGMCVWKP